MAPATLAPRLRNRRLVLWVKALKSPSMVPVDILISPLGGPTAEKRTDG
jgi:hypothetical protein